MIKRNRYMDEKSPLSTTASILILLNYFLGYLVVYPLIGHALTRAMGDTSVLISNEILIGIVIFTTVVSIILAWPLFKDERSIKTKKPIKKFLITYGLMYLTMLILNPLVALLTNSDSSQNQNLIIESLKSQPFYVILSAIIMAPIVEEIVFRGVLFRKIRSEYRYWTAIIISAITFGLMHIFGSLIEGDINDLPFVIVYTVLGLFFVKIYEETGKIKYAIALHFLNNVVGILAIYLLLSELI
jgi:membrane protease YdiL (CAAX protease family)